MRAVGAALTGLRTETETCGICRRTSGGNDCRTTWKVAPSPARWSRHASAMGFRQLAHKPESEVQPAGLHSWGGDVPFEDAPLFFHRDPASFVAHRNPGAGLGGPRPTRRSGDPHHTSVHSTAGS